MATERLTTRAAVKGWLGIGDDSTSGDEGIDRVILAASQFVRNYLNWGPSFGATEYNQFQVGHGRSSLMLKHWPVISISSLHIGGTNIASATFASGVPSNGYYLGPLRDAPMSIDLAGYSFWRGSPVQVIYRAGFETSQSFVLAVDEGNIVPVVPTDRGQWIADVRVTKGGVEMVSILTGTPLTGQYRVDDYGTYTFSTADVGQTVVITYSYVPWDLAQATTELISEWLKRKDRIGLLSKSLGGQETVSFSQADMNNSVKGMLQSYKNVVPL